MRSSFCWLISQMPAMAGVGQGQSEEPVLSQILPRVQGPKHVSHPPPLLAQAHSRQLSFEWVLIQEATVLANS